jgi:biliverdin reductase/flavin reductase
VRLVIFGATGRTGRSTVDAALHGGFEVTAAARRLEGLPDDVRGAEVDARDADSVAEALRDADAVISAMGIPTDSPPTTALSEATSTVIGVMTTAGIDRIVIVVNGSVFLEAPRVGPYEVVDVEHRRGLEVVRRSELEWTALAPPWLKDDAATGSYEAVVEGAAGGTWIAREDLASALVDAVGHDDWRRHVVGISVG